MTFRKATSTYRERLITALANGKLLWMKSQGEQNLATRTCTYIIYSLKEASLFNIALSDDKLLAVTIWMPIDEGEAALEQYWSQIQNLPAFAKHASLDRPQLIKGSRFLLEGSALGTMTSPSFISGLKWLGRHGLLFEVTVNVQSQGVGTLEEVIDCISRVREGQAEEEQTTFILGVKDETVRESC